MNAWYQSLAGAEVQLAARTMRRIGLEGFGADDTGVIEQPAELADVFRLGQVLGAVEDGQIDAMMALEHGTTQQVEVVNTLASCTLKALRQAVEAQVDAAMRTVQAEPSDGYAELLDWAESDGWEFPVWLRNGGEGWNGLAMTSGQGLSVIYCPVWKVEGAFGDVLCAFASWLAEESLKCTSLDLLEYRHSVQGFTPPAMSEDEVKRVSVLDGAAVVEWLRTADEQGFEEISYWAEEPEMLEMFAESARDLACRRADFYLRLNRVFGKASSPAEKLAQVVKHAEQCDASPLREIVLRAAAALAGPSTRSYLDAVDYGSNFDRLPGEGALVDLGMNISGEDEAYSEQNDALWNSEDLGALPLKMDSEMLVALLVRVTICERVLLALSASLGPA